MIAPASFPVTGAEAIVNIKLLKALSDSGKFEIDLISKKNKWQHYQSSVLSDYGVKLKSINIIEVDNRITVKVIVQHLFSLIQFGVIFKGIHWSFVALSIVKELLRTNRYDFVMTKNSPSFLLGWYVKKKYGIKWVASWNDPYPTSKYPFPYGKGWDSKSSFFETISIKIMCEADVHIFPSDRIRDYMLKYMDVFDKEIKVIPHVVLDDFSYFQKPISNKLKVVCMGNLSSPRDPSMFFNALCRLDKMYYGLNMEIVLIGVFDANIYVDIKQKRLQHLIKIKSSVSYLESLKQLKSFDIAVIIEADCKEGIFMPTKVSDFMQCGVITFAVSPKIGVLNDLFNQGYIKYFADVSNEDAIFNELNRLYSDYLQNNLRNDRRIPDNFTEKYVVSEYLKL